jgi:hypothetical protein
MCRWQEKTAGHSLLDDLAELSKVKAKLELIGDYEDVEKVRDVLKELSKR